jgi:hypothetical protein
MPSTHSNRYAISTATVNAGLLFTATHAPTPLHYVLGDMKVLTPAEVLHYTIHALRHRSGAYHLVSSHHAHPFDEVFGPEAARAIEPAGKLARQALRSRAEGRRPGARPV